MTATPQFYYFGCIRDSGHYFWKSPINRGTNAIGPWGFRIDGGLCPKSRVEGAAAITKLNGWTALSFWDNSVDRRPGSNSNFLTNEDLDFEGMIAKARVRFPQVIDRLPFSISLAELPHDHD